MPEQPPTDPWAPGGAPDDPDPTGDGPYVIGAIVAMATAFAFAGHALNDLVDSDGRNLPLQLMLSGASLGGALVLLRRIGPRRGG